MTVDAAMKDSLLAYWNSRSPRDRVILAGVGAFAVIALTWAYVWQPMLAARLRLRAELPQMRAAAMEMKSAATEVARLGGLPQPEPKDAIAAAKSATEAANLDQDGIQFAALGANRVQVNAPNVAFDSWVDFVRQLQISAFGRVESMHITALGEPGAVRVQAVLVFPVR